MIFSVPFFPIKKEAKQVEKAPKIAVLTSYSMKIPTKIKLTKKEETVIKNLKLETWNNKKRILYSVLRSVAYKVKKLNS